MGLFDNIRCKMLQLAEERDTIWQTKDTPAQFLDEYEIREDGTFGIEHMTPKTAAIQRRKG
jgi:hypothetical protein